jgi:hypothetical protein
LRTKPRGTLLSPKIGRYSTLLAFAWPLPILHTDLAASLFINILNKTSFRLAGLNKRGEVIVRKHLSRAQLLRFTAKPEIPPNIWWLTS